MTKEQYVNMNRGINNGGDLPPDVLCAIYDDISTNEIKMKAGASKLLKCGCPAKNALHFYETRIEMKWENCSYESRSGRR